MIDNVKSLFKPSDCSICNNTREVDIRDPLYGIRKHACRCTRVEEGYKFYMRSRIPDNYQHYTWEDYNNHDNSTNVKSFTTLKRLCTDKLYQLVKEGVDLLLTGSIATGKTMLGCIALREYTLRGYTALYIRGEQIAMFMDKQRTFDKEQNDYDFTLAELYDSKVLMIDGFDNMCAESFPPMIRISINELLKERKRKGLSHILTSRMSITELGEKNRFLGEMVYTIFELAFQGSYLKTARQNLVTRLGTADDK